MLLMFVHISEVTDYARYQSNHEVASSSLPPSPGIPDFAAAKLSSEYLDQMSEDHLLIPKCNISLSQCVGQGLLIFLQFLYVMFLLLLYSLQFVYMHAIWLKCTHTCMPATCK